MHSKAWILLFILPLAILFILRFMGYDGMVGQDAYAYVDYAKAIKVWINGGPHPGNFLWPPGYSLFGALLSYLGIPVSLAMQLISSLSLSGVLFFLHKFITNQNYGAKTKFDPIIPSSYLLLFGMFAPYFLRASMVTSSDMIACFWVAIAVYYFHQYNTQTHFKNLLLAALAGSMGTIVRYPVFLLLLPFTIYSIYVWSRKGKNIFHLFVLIVPILIVMLYNIFNPELFSFAKHDSISRWQLSNVFTTRFQSINGISNHTIPNILFIFSPFYHLGFLLPGWAFLFKSIYDKKYIHPLYTLCLLSYFIYTLFLAGYHEQNPRHLLIVYPLVLILCYDGYRWAFNQLKTKKLQNAILSLTIFCQVLLFARSMQASIYRNALEQKISLTLIEENAFLTNSDKQPILYGFDIDIALKSRGVPFEVRNMYQKKYTEFEVGSFVIFNQAKLQKQWQGMNPMVNWENIKKTHDLALLNDFGDGWALYLIGQKVIMQ